MRTGRARESRHLIRRLIDGPHPPVPPDHDVRFAALIDRVSGLKERQVVILEEEFPHGPATGRPRIACRVTGSPGRLRSRV